MAEVRVQEGEPLENALRRFKRKVQQEDIIKEVKRHSFYLKPGEKRRVKEALSLIHISFDDGEDGVLLWERDLEVDLGEFGLAIGAQIFVAEAADDLNCLLYTSRCV